MPFVFAPLPFVLPDADAGLLLSLSARIECCRFVAEEFWRMRDDCGLTGAGVSVGNAKEECNGEDASAGDACAELRPLVWHVSN